jgi:uncharacterized membrane protein YdjX (TVP38/TMEM64 family)
MFSKITLKEILGIVIIAVLFLAAVYYSGQYESYLENSILNEGVLGMFLYVVVTVLAIVIAPISTFPLLPVAVVLWGSTLGAVLSIIGWTLGGVLAFILAREFGRPVVRKIVNIEKAENLALAVAGKHMFLSIVFLRMILPVDLLSYALGLFVPVSLRTYTLATLIGVMPFAFIFSYAISLSEFYQVFTLALTAGIIVLGYLRIGKIIRRRKYEIER